MAADKSLTLAADAPQSYVVVKGDTLWGISGKFLKEPWRWPEIWRMNEASIKDPHWIYPGDVIYLSYDQQGKPYLSLSKPGKSGAGGGTERLQPRVYAEDIDAVIPSIPVREIRPFLIEPLVIDPDGLDRDPRIAATEEERVYLGSGNTAYVTGMEQDTTNWVVYRHGKSYNDPDTGEFLGTEAVFVGTVKLLEPGDPSVVEITSTKVEMGVGDRLRPAPSPEVINYVPHPPDAEIDGRVMSISGSVDTGVGEAGPLSVITLSKGLQDGLDVGSVLALYRFREVRARNDDGTASMLTLPEERYGYVFVFRVFERMSYGLIVSAQRAVKPGDIIRNP